MAQFAPTVRLHVDGTNGASAVVGSGQAVPWFVRAFPYPGYVSHLGIAGFAFDLVQLDGPVGISLNGVVSRPDEIAPFDRPLGISVGSATGSGSGFGGRVVPNSLGGADLLGVGGCMNTTGQALPVASMVATSATIVPGIGLSTAGQTLASGQFTAPLRVGTYRVGIGRSHVNTLGTINPPPLASLVLRADVIDRGLVVVVACFADFNGDNALSVQDIFDFLEAYFAGNLAADYDGSGGLSVQDIFDFLEDYFVGCEF